MRTATMQSLPETGIKKVSGAEHYHRGEIVQRLISRDSIRPPFHEASGKSLPAIDFLWILFERPFLLAENRVTLCVDPICFFCRNMATNTVNFVVGRNILLWIVDGVERPTPATAPVWVVRERFFFGVLNHHEPLLDLTIPMNVAGRHFTLLTRSDFLHERCTLRPFASISEGRHRLRLGVDVMHFPKPALFVFNVPRSQMDPLKSVVLRKSYGAVFADVFPKSPFRGGLIRNRSLVGPVLRSAVNPGSQQGESRH